jgi:hypothetical protein
MKVRALRIEYIVVPVRRQAVTMSFEVLVVGGDSVGAVEYCEKIREQVDEHQRPWRGWRRVLLKPRGKLVVPSQFNKRENL